MMVNAGKCEACLGLELCEKIFSYFFPAESGLYGKANTTVLALRKPAYPSSVEGL
jgi:hypothetical protein